MTPAPIYLKFETRSSAIIVEQLIYETNSRPVRVHTILYCTVQYL